MSEGASAGMIHVNGCNQVCTVSSVMSQYSSVVLSHQPTSVIQRSACLPAGVFTRCYIFYHVILSVEIMRQMLAKKLSNIDFEQLFTHSMIRF